MVVLNLKLSVVKQAWAIGFTSICLSAFGQGANLNNHVVRPGYVASSMMDKENPDYSDIKGNCFWNQEWLPARVSMRNGHVYNFLKAKLNFYTQTIHYIDEKGAEVATKSGISSIIFRSLTDTSATVAFETLSEPNLSEIFMHVLVEGRIRLLKATATKLIKRETDPLLAKKEWMFESTDVYFIDSNGDVRELKGLSNRNVFSVLNEESGDANWLKEHNNKLKKENEVIAFITYKNSIAR